MELYLFLSGHDAETICITVEEGCLQKVTPLVEEFAQENWLIIERKKQSDHKKTFFVFLLRKAHPLLDMDMEQLAEGLNVHLARSSFRRIQELKMP